MGKTFELDLCAWCFVLGPARTKYKIQSTKYKDQRPKAKDLKPTQGMSETYSYLWLSLFPLTYLAHVAEEYWAGGGYSNYLLKTYSVELSQQRFVVFFLMLLGIILSVTMRFPLTMIAILSSIIIGNAMIHTIRSIGVRGYTPGLITAVVLWLPLGVFSLKEVWPLTSIGRILMASLVGVIVNWVVELISFNRPARQQQAETHQ
jgi:FtsH-binding integral membrane protein